MFLARKLVLAHFWVAFAAFLGAIVLGAWQMYIRSPLSPWINNPEHYYSSVTSHWTVMSYLLPTLGAMGIGYAVAQAVSAATNHKRAQTLQYIAAGGVIFAYLVHNLVAYNALIVQNDIWGMLAAAFGAYWAYQRIISN